MLVQSLTRLFSSNGSELRRRLRIAYNDQTSSHLRAVLIDLLRPTGEELEIFESEIPGIAPFRLGTPAHPEHEAVPTRLPHERKTNLYNRLAAFNFPAIAESSAHHLELTRARAFVLRKGACPSHLNSIGDGVIIPMSQQMVTYLNPVAEAMTGWTSTGALAGRLARGVPNYRHHNPEHTVNPWLLPCGKIKPWD